MDICCLMFSLFRLLRKNIFRFGNIKRHYHLANISRMLNYILICKNNAWIIRIVINLSNFALIPPPPPCSIFFLHLTDRLIKSQRLATHKLFGRTDWVWVGARFGLLNMQRAMMGLDWWNRIDPHLSDMVRVDKERIRTLLVRWGIISPFEKKRWLHVEPVEKKGKVPN